MNVSGRSRVKIRERIPPFASGVKERFIGDIGSLARQYNLWVNSGSGIAPRAWYKAISAP